MSDHQKALSSLAHRILRALFLCDHAKATRKVIDGATFLECPCGHVEEVRPKYSYRFKGHDETKATAAAKRARAADDRRRAVAAQRAKPAGKREETPAPAIRKVAG